MLIEWFDVILFVLAFIGYTLTIPNRSMGYGEFKSFSKEKLSSIFNAKKE